MKPRIILVGGSGFLGTVLAEYYTKLNAEVLILTRRPRLRTDGVREVVWDGRTPGDWCREFEGARAVINLAGVSVNCRYHAANRKRMMDSRLDSTRVLGEAIGSCQNPPPVWLNSSTATIYRHTYGPGWDEGGEVGGCAEAKDIFSVHIATEWEREFFAAMTPRTRKVALRSAMVLGHGDNSVLPNLLRLARWGLGGRMGAGRQYVSWIHQADFCRAVNWLIQDSAIEGPVNVSAPNPMPNAEFMAMIRRACGARFGLPAANWMLEVGAFFMRTETELIIKSRRVLPGRLMADGFQFQYPELSRALEQLTA
jgi:uncharacterized protein (TIGR01777 family)